MIGKLSTYIRYGVRVMEFTKTKQNYGVIKQLIDLSITAIVCLVVLYFAVFFSLRFVIDVFVPPVGDYDLNHKLKDLLTCLNIVLCFSIYLAIVIGFINAKLKYIKYLINCIHFMRGGDFTAETEIRGNDELSHLATHIDELRHKINESNITEKNRAMKQYQLLTSISHDLRTPLTSIIGYLEILSDRDFGDNEKEKRYLNLSLNRSLQLQELINSAFEHFYLTDKENQSIELLRCNSISGLKNIILDRAQLLSQHNFTYDVQMPSERFAIVYDVRLMERLFDNVFANILRYAEKYSLVAVEGKILGSSLIITIANRIEPCCKRSERTGIGIKNCKKIMELHNGSFENGVGDVGYTVTITLPIKNTQDYNNK